MIIRGSLVDNIYYGLNSQERNEGLVIDLLNKFKVFESINTETLNKVVSNKSYLGKCKKLHLLEP